MPETDPSEAGRQPVRFLGGGRIIANRAAVMALATQLLVVFAAIGQTRPRLADTSLYTKLASGCGEFDMTSWRHPTKAVFDREAKSVRRLQLCNSRVYRVFFTELLCDPRRASQRWLCIQAGYGSVQGECEPSIFDSRYPGQRDNLVIIEVGVRADRTAQFSLEQYEG
jgi:hypothetical protein